MDVREIKIRNENKSFIEIRVYCDNGIFSSYDIIYDKTINNIIMTYLDDFSYYYYGSDYKLIHHSGICETFIYSKQYLSIIYDEYSPNYNFKLNEADIIKLEMNNEDELTIKTNLDHIIIDYKEGSLIHCNPIKLNQKGEDSQYLYHSELIKKFKTYKFINITKEDNKINHFFYDNDIEKCITLYIDLEKEIIIKETCCGLICKHYYYGFDHIIVFEGEYKSITHYRKNNLIYYIDTLLNIKGKVFHDEYLMFDIDISKSQFNDDIIGQSIKFKIEYPFEYSYDPLLEYYEDLFFEENYGDEDEEEN